MSKHLFISLALVGMFVCAFVPAVNAFGAIANPESPIVIPVTDEPASASGANAGGIAQPVANVPSLESFAKTVNTGRAGTVAGVCAANLFCYKAVQQPAGNAAYVSSLRDTVTNFGLAAKSGTVGLLAHNYLAGALFSKLAVGNEVNIVNGDGTVQRYVVTQVSHFQALSPDDPYSNFVDLEKGGQLSSTDLFAKVYAGGNKVVFQTCIAANGNASWGRLFVTATPVQ